jgi:hypothetical protein
LGGNKTVDFATFKALASKLVRSVLSLVGVIFFLTLTLPFSLSLYLPLSLSPAPTLSILAQSCTSNSSASLHVPFARHLRPIFHQFIYSSIVGSLWPLQSCPSKEEVIEAFSVFDIQGNGYIALKELTLVLKSLGEGLEDEILGKLSSISTPDQDNQVNYRHLIDVMMTDL